MAAKIIIPEQVSKELIEDYNCGLRLDALYAKYERFGSATTIARHLKRLGIHNRTKSGPRSAECAICGDIVFRGRLCRKHYREVLSRNKGCCNVMDCTSLQIAKGMCSLHYQRAINGHPLIRDVACWLNTQGYICEYIPNHMQANSDGRVLQHRKVMSEYVGRRLESFETVHHKNGDKMDNSIDNLELWSGIHPSGQRVEDLIEFAETILRMYG